MPCSSVVNMKNCLIIGSGSAACRHSRILSQLGYNCHFFSHSNRKSDQLFFKNAFTDELKDITRNNVKNYQLFVIANNTCRHSEYFQKLSRLGISNHTIFCEKPGAIGMATTNILYNLRFLDINFEKLGKPIEFVHHSDATKWPSDQDPKTRYIFRSDLDGGVIFTHSHEIDFVYSYALPPMSFLSEEMYARIRLDINSEKYIEAVRMEIDGLKLDLSLTSKKPCRYWDFEKGRLLFYGSPLNESERANTTYISSSLIEESYLKMWMSKLGGSSVSHIDRNYLSRTNYLIIAQKDVLS